VKDKNNFKVLSHPVLSDTEREQRSEGSHVMHVCPSGKSIIMMKVSIGRTEEFSLYRTVNTLCLGYTNQQVNAVQ
jgi:hypothetical protein